MDVDEIERRETARREAALVDGLPYTAHVGRVKSMRQAGDDDEAAALLLRLIEAVEREAQFSVPGRGAIAPWYFDELVRIYRKAGMAVEAGLVQQRYARLAVASETAALAATRSFAASLGEQRQLEVAPAQPITSAKPRSAGYYAGRGLGRLLAFVVGRKR